MSESTQNYIFIPIIFIDREYLNFRYNFLNTKSCRRTYVDNERTAKTDAF